MHPGRTDDRRRPWSVFATPTLGLVALGLASLGLYWVGITRQYPLAKGLLAYHRSWPGLVDFSLRAGWRHAGVYALLVLCYMLALRLAARIPPRQVVPAIVVVGSGWLCAPPACCRHIPASRSISLTTWCAAGCRPCSV
jgi:hypothetical protein